MATAEIGEKVVFIHGNSNFPSNLIFKNSGSKINPSTFYTTNDNKRIKFLFQPDIITSAREVKIDINQNMIIKELTKMNKPTINLLYLISLNELYSTGMNKLYKSIVKYYDCIKTGLPNKIEVYLVFLQNENKKDSLTKNNDISSLVKDYPNYGYVNENNFENIDTCDNANELRNIWNSIMKEIKPNKKSEKSIPNQFQPTIRSFIVLGIGDEGIKIADLLNGGSDAKFENNNNIRIKKNDDRGFEIININGLNNADIPLSVWYENLKLAIKVSNPCISHTFLIVINLRDDYLNHFTYQALVGFIQLMNSNGYNFLEKSILVFVHKQEEPCKNCTAQSDEIENEASQLCENCITDKHINLEKMLKQILSSEKWVKFETIDKLIKKRLHIASNKKEDIEKLVSNLIEMTKPTINLIFHGNTDFTQEQIKMKLSYDMNENVNDIKHESFRLVLHFSKDYVKFKDIDEQNFINEDAIKLINEDGQDFDGISIIVFLVNLGVQYDYGMKCYLEKLISIYDSKKEDKIWKHVVFLFQVPESAEKLSEQSVKTQIIYKIESLKTFIDMSGESNFSIIYNQTKSEEIIDMLVQQGMKVFEKSKGKKYINEMLTDEIITSALVKVKASKDEKEEKEEKDYKGENIDITPQSVYKFYHKDDK